MLYVPNKINISTKQLIAFLFQSEAKTTVIQGIIKKQLYRECLKNVNIFISVPL